MCCSYLIFSAALSGLGLLVAALVARARGFLIVAGLLAAPAGLADALFVPEYWAPEHVVSKYVSIEGMLFSFGNGVLIAAMPVIFWRGFRPGRRRLWQVILRCSGPMLAGFAIFLIFWQQGLGSLMIMHAAFIGFAAMFLILAALGWLSAPVVLAGGLGFALIYIAQAGLWLWLDPGALGYWSAASYLGTLPVWPHLPVEEVIWSALYGALWASLMLYGFDIPVRERALGEGGGKGRLP